MRKAFAMAVLAAGLFGLVTKASDEPAANLPPGEIVYVGHGNLYDNGKGNYYVEILANFTGGDKQKLYRARGFYWTPYSEITKEWPTVNYEIGNTAGSYQHWTTIPLGTTLADAIWFEGGLMMSMHLDRADNMVWNNIVNGESFTNLEDPPALSLVAMKPEKPKLVWIPLTQRRSE